MRDGFSKLLEVKNASFFFGIKMDDMEWTDESVDGEVDSAWKGSPVGGLYTGWEGVVSSSQDDTWKYWDINLFGLAESQYGMTTYSRPRQKSKVAAHTVRHSHGPVQLFLLTQVYILPFCLQNRLNSTAISPDSRWVVSGSVGHTVRIWDLHNAALQCRGGINFGGVWPVDFCPTENYLASGGADGDTALEIRPKGLVVAARLL